MTTSSHLRRTALGAIVAPMVLAVPAAAACPVAGAGHHPPRHHGTVVVAAGPLRDLDPATPGPFDDAAATLRIVATGSGSHAVLRVRGTAPEADGSTFGAHLHVGPCVAGDGAAAGAHYNTDVLAGVTPPEVGERTELWLDMTVHAGRARSTTSVPFVPAPGTRSVVIHAMETDHDTGTAGARLACLPVEW